MPGKSAEGNGFTRAISATGSVSALSPMHSLSDGEDFPPADFTGVMIASALVSFDSLNKGCDQSCREVSNSDYAKRPARAEVVGNPTDDPERRTSSLRV